MRAAAQLYTVREFLKTPDDIARSLHKIKQIGYNAVQVSGVGSIDSAELKRIAVKEDLMICATHVSYNDLKEHFEEVVEKHHIWDCKYVGIGGLPKEYQKSADLYRSFAQEASEIGFKLQEHGLQFIYHNHNFELARYEGQSAMEILLKESDPKAFHFELDVYWLQAGGADPVEWIYKVSDRMKVVHLKDMGVTADRKQYFAEVGEGNMNWSAILEGCRKIGVEWGAVEQDICPGDPFESLERSLRNLERMGVYS